MPRFISLAFTLLLFPALLLGRDTREQQRIDYLMQSLSSLKGAVFIRNGKEYSGEKASAHVKSKLWWAGKRVQTVREFIVGVASRSEATGKPYEIRMKNGTQGPLEKWLLGRLAVYEKGSKK